MIDKGLLTALQKLILQETIFLRHYNAQVVDNKDPKKKGAVKVTIPELGFDTASNGLWCKPRQANSLTTPGEKKWVEMHFRNGDQSKPVYIGLALEMDGTIPKSFDGNPKTHVLFEDPDDSLKNVVYNGTTKKIKILGDIDNAVRFSKMQSAFDSLKSTVNAFVTTFNSHTHTVSGSVTLAPGAPAASSTANISPAKINEIQVP